MRVNYLGIDPGLGGGLAFLSHNAAVLCPMPRTERDLLDLLREIASRGPCHAVIERLGGMPRGADGRPKQTPKTMLLLGPNYGGIRMGLLAAGIPFDEILPVVWQRSFGLTGGKDGRTAKKNRHKQKAQQLLPESRLTHAVADAALLAIYASRHYPAPD